MNMSIPKNLPGGKSRRAIKYFVLIAGVVMTCELVSCNSLSDGNRGITFNEVFYNPVMAADMMGDPFVAFYNGFYYYTHSSGTNLTIRKSKTLSGLLSTANTAKVVWLAQDNNLSLIWAPEIHFIENEKRWYAYLAGSDNDATVDGQPIFNKNLVHRMYALKSRTDDPMGEWDFIGKLELPEDKWAIDGTLFQHPEGKLYFIWAGWPENLLLINKEPENLYICELETPSKVKEGTRRVLIAEAFYDWEKIGRAHNEGPFILTTPAGEIKCVYSASWAMADYYCIGELTLTGDPMNSGSWVKKSAPLLRGDKERHVVAPGHCSFTLSPDKREIWMVYHAAKDWGSGFDRNARIQRVNFNSEGQIEMGGPLDLNEPYKLPSGERVERYLFDCESGKAAGAVVESYPGAHNGKAVKLMEEDSSVEIPLSGLAGDYMIYLRYSSPYSSSKDLTVKINDQAYRFSMKKCGGEGQFGMVGGMGISLSGGGRLCLYGPSGLILDALILEKI
jgi:GH43 family beta-xylosidase